MKTSVPRISKVTLKNGGASISVLDDPKIRDTEFIDAVMKHDDYNIEGFVVISWGQDFGYVLDWANRDDSPLRPSAIPMYVFSILQQSIINTKTLQNIEEL